MAHLSISSVWEEEGFLFFFAFFLFSFPGSFPPMNGCRFPLILSDVCFSFRMLLHLCLIACALAQGVQQEFSQEYPELTWSASIPNAVPKVVFEFLELFNWGDYHVVFHRARQNPRRDSYWGKFFERYNIPIPPPHLQEGTLENGVEFLCMHRAMIHQLVELFGDVPVTNDPDGRETFAEMMEGWRTDEEALAALRKANADMSFFVGALKNLNDFGSFKSEGEFGQYIQSRGILLQPPAEFDVNPRPFAGMHNQLHGAMSDSSQIGVQHVRYNLHSILFWRLHGWIDNKWKQFEASRQRSVEEQQVYDKHMHAVGSRLDKMSPALQQSVEEKAEKEATRIAAELEEEERRLEKESRAEKEAKEREQEQRRIRAEEAEEAEAAHIASAKEAARVAAAREQERIQQRAEQEVEAEASRLQQSQTREQQESETEREELAEAEKEESAEAAREESAEAEREESAEAEKEESAEAAFDTQTEETEARRPNRNNGRAETQASYQSACARSNGSCLNVNTNSCSNGSFSRGQCPGSSAIQCCKASSTSSYNPKPSYQRSDSACTRSKGSCLNVNTNSCSNGSFFSGLCPGSSSVQCCKASPVSAPSYQRSSSACSRSKGSCLNVKTNSCSNGSFFSGLCPGSSSIQCCKAAPVSSYQSSRSACARSNGSCLNVNTNSCSNGSFSRGLCPGSSSIQCCKTSSSSSYKSSPSYRVPAARYGAMSTGRSLLGFSSRNQRRAARKERRRIRRMQRKQRRMEQRKNPRSVIQKLFRQLVRAFKGTVRIPSRLCDQADPFVFASIVDFPCSNLAPECSTPKCPQGPNTRS